MQATVIILFFIILGIYLFWQNKQFKKESSLNNNFSTNEPINWEICINTKDNFSIQYPPYFNWDKETCNYLVQDYSLLSNIKVTNSVEDLRKNWLLSIKVYPVDIEPGSWLLANRCSHLSGCSEFIPGLLSNSIQTNINSHYYESDLVVNLNKKIVVFVLNARNPAVELSPGSRQVFNQIVSTFKFIQ